MQDYLHHIIITTDYRRGGVIPPILNDGVVTGGAMTAPLQFDNFFPIPYDEFY